MSEHVHEPMEGFDNGHRPHIDRKQIWMIWVWLLVLTILEVGVVYVPMAKPLLVTILCTMAIVKAGIVALYYMHLKYETKILQWTVAWGALQTACELAKSNKRPLEVVAVLNPNQPGEELIEAHLSLARQVARSHDVKVRTTLLDGSAATALVEHVSTSRPWLVLAGRHGLDTTEQESDLGSVTEHLLRFGPSNMLIVSREWSPSESTHQQVVPS